jgi:hypothetical protein
MTALSDIIQQVRWRVDMPEQNQYITDPEFISYINSSYRELYDILTISNVDFALTIQGETAGTTTNTISNFQKIQLPADFAELRAVHFYFPSAPQPWVTLKKASIAEWNRFNFPLMQTMYGMPLLHYIGPIDGYVAIAPEASCQGTYRLLYTPALPVLVNTTDTIPSYIDNRTWQEYVVVDVCAKALTKQQDDPTAFLVQKEALKKRIEASAPQRDSGSPKVGRNTRHRGNDYYFGLPFFWR